MSSPHATLRRRLRLLPLLGAVAIGACGLGTLAEIVPSDAAEWEPLLVGRWTDSAGDESAVITGDSTAGYAIAYTDEDSLLGHFTARLGRLGDRRVLDLDPDDPELGASPVYTSLLLPLHYPIVIERVTATELEFRGIEHDSLNAFLRRAPSATPHFYDGDELILTAPTPELRRFLAEFMRRPGVLTETATWRRSR